MNDIEEIKEIEEIRELIKLITDVTATDDPCVCWVKFGNEKSDFESYINGTEIAPMTFPLSRHDTLEGVKKRFKMYLCNLKREKLEHLIMKRAEFIERSDELNSQIADMQREKSI